VPSRFTELEKPVLLPRRRHARYFQQRAPVAADSREPNPAGLHPALLFTGSVIATYRVKIQVLDGVITNPVELVLTGKIV
jgi:hypothetical protein